MKDEIYSKKISAGSRRSYFIDLKRRERGDVYIVLTESYLNAQGQEERNRIQINKEDFKKIEEGMSEVLTYVKDELKIAFH